MTAVPYVAARLEEMSAVRLSATFFLFPFQCEHSMNLKSYFKYIYHMYSNKEPVAFFLALLETVR